MRSFEKRNMRAFNLYGILVLLGITALSFMIFMSVRSSDEDHVTYAGCKLYDEENMLIEVKEDSKLVKKWDGKYYMTDESGETLCLGECPTIYNPEQANLSILGTCYRVYPDGTTQKYARGLEVSDLQEPALYKIKDRVYLLVGREISSYEGTFKSEGYMKLTLDKNGNALLQAEGLSSKTINPVILRNGELFMDVAAEILYSNGMEVNLRKVIGSTNEYEDAPVLYEITGIQRPEMSTANLPVPDIENYYITAGAGGKGGSGSQGGKGGLGGTGGIGGIGGIGGNGGSGGNGGNGGNGGHGGNGGNGGTGGQGGIGGDAGTNFDDTTYFVQMTGTAAQETSITVKYAVYDASNKVGKILLRLTDESGASTDYLLNKYNTSHTVYSLNTNHTYKAELIYYLYWIDNGAYVVDTNTEYSAGIVTLKTGDLQARVETAKKTAGNLTVRVYMPDIDFTGGNIYWTETYLNSGVEATTTGDPLLKVTAASSSGQKIDIPLSKDSQSVSIKSISYTTQDGNTVSINPNYYEYTAGYGGGESSNSGSSSSGSGSDSTDSGSGTTGQSEGAGTASTNDPGSNNSQSGDNSSGSETNNNLQTTSVQEPALPVNRSDSQGDSGQTE